MLLKEWKWRGINVFAICYEEYGYYREICLLVQDRKRSTGYLAILDIHFERGRI